MKNLKKLFALLLAMAMIFSLFAGCGSSDDEEETEVEEETEIEEDVDVVEESYFPLAEEETISIWMSYPPIFTGLADDGPADFAIFKYVEETLNIDLEWQTASYVDASTNLNVMIASGEYTDIIWNLFNYYSGSKDQAIDDEIIYNMESYIYDYMPTLLSILDENEIYWTELSTDNGNIPYISLITDLDNALTNGGWVINTDILDATSVTYSVDEITTIDEWEEIAAAMQIEAGVEHPIYMAYTGYYYQNSIGYAYGTATMFASRYSGLQAYSYNEDGELKFDATGEEYKNYLAKMHEWYELGYIDPDFMSYTTSDQFPSDEDIVNREVAFFPSNTNTMAFSSYTGDEAVNVEALSIPKLTEDQEILLGVGL